MKPQLACLAEYEEWRAGLPVALEERVLAIVNRYCGKVGCCDERVIANLCPGQEIKGVLLGLERTKVLRSKAMIYDQTNRKGTMWTLR